MFARRAEYERPRAGGLAPFLAERGFRTVAFDFRGHGESGPLASKGGAWTYDDLVFHNLPAVTECARARADGLPVVVIGHSLGGHVALASQAAGALNADAIVGFAMNVWLRELEPSPLVWAAKRALLDGAQRIAERRGFFPARALRLGSDDEALGYFRAFHAFSTSGRWGSADGKVDYLARRPDVTIPVMSIASAGDRLNCRPVCAARFVSKLGGPVELVEIKRGDDGRAPPGHMALVTSHRAHSVWLRVAEWIARLPLR